MQHKLLFKVLYFLFMAYLWNFCDTFLRPWAKRIFLFFQIFSRCWDTVVQSYTTSARKIFGEVKKRRVQAEKYSYRSTEKTNMFKAKRLIEKVGTRYLKTGALTTSADNSWPPPLPFHTALKIPQPNIFMLYQHGSSSQTHSLT